MALSMVPQWIPSGSSGPFLALASFFCKTIARWPRAPQWIFLESFYIQAFLERAAKIGESHEGLSSHPLFSPVIGYPSRGQQEYLDHSAFSSPTGLVGHFHGHHSETWLLFRTFGHTFFFLAWILTRILYKYKSSSRNFFIYSTMSSEFSWTI